MKKDYSTPEMEVVELEKEDIILTSGTCEDVCACHGVVGEER